MDGFGLYDVVLREYLRADKSPAQVLQACAAWICVPRPVDMIPVAVTA